MSCAWLALAPAETASASLRRAAAAWSPARCAAVAAWRHRASGGFPPAARSSGSNIACASHQAPSFSPSTWLSRNASPGQRSGASAAGSSCRSKAAARAGYVVVAGLGLIEHGKRCAAHLSGVLRANCSEGTAMPARLFVDPPLVAGNDFSLPPNAARHAQVLRLQPGATLTLFDGCGGEFAATVAHMGRSEVRVHVGAHDPVRRELARSVTLALGMPANERMDTLVEKATELGVAALVPLTCERSVLRLHGERAEKKLAHWRGVAIAACEQSGRAQVPRGLASRRAAVLVSLLAGNGRRRPLAAQPGQSASAGPSCCGARGTHARPRAFAQRPGGRARARPKRPWRCAAASPR